MLRIIVFSCLLVVFTTQSETPKYLDGGLGYLSKKLNKKFVAPTTTISRQEHSDHIHQPSNSILEAVPVSQVVNVPAPEKTAYNSQEPSLDLPSPTIDTSPEPEISYNSKTAEVITESELIKEPLNVIDVTSKEPIVMSTLPSYFYDAFPISKELPVPVSKPRQSYPEIVYQFAVPYVAYDPIPEVSTETTTSTTTTTLPTTQVSTTEVPVTTTTLPSCINGEIYPTDTGSCDQFLMCYNSVVVLLICPQGMGFNFETQRCDWSQYVPACNTQGT